MCAWTQAPAAGVIELARTRALLATGRAFAESLSDRRELIQTLATHLANSSGDICLVRLRDDEGDWDGDFAFAPSGSSLQTAFQDLTRVSVMDDGTSLGLLRPVVIRGQTLRRAFAPAESPPDALPAQISLLREFNVRGLLGVPLRSGGQLVGAVALIRLSRERPYTEADERFVSEMAEFAALAIGVSDQLRAAERDRSEVDRLLEQQAALVQLGRWTLDRTDPERLFDLAVQTVASTLGVQFCGIGLLNADAGPLSVRLVAGVGWREGLVGNYVSVLPPEVAKGIETPRVLVWEEARAPLAVLAEHSIRCAAGAPIGPPDGSDPPIGLVAALSTEPDAFSSSDIPFLESVGQILGSAIDRHQLVRALRERAEEFRALAEHSPDIIARFDSDLRHVYVNPAVEQAMGLPSDQIVGRTDRELGVPEEILVPLELALRSAFRTAHQQTLSMRYAFADGEHTFEVRLVPELAQDGSVISVLSVARDVTDRERALAERERMYQEVLERERRLQRILEGVVADYQAERRRATGAVVLGHLTPREREILLLLAKGQSNSEIARALSLSVGTVKNHVAEILSKLGVADRTQAAVRALALGLAPLDVQST